MKTHSMKYVILSYNVKTGVIIHHIEQIHYMVMTY